MARNTSVNVGVNFVPDTTQLDSALKQFNNVDLQTKVTGISGDVLAPFRQSVEDLNAAMASGRGENEIAQLMDRVKTEANAARASLDAATAGIKAFYDSPVNQNNLKAISEIDAKLESATNQLKQWNKNKSALNNLRQLASQSGFDINTTARGRMKQIKDIEALRDAQGNLNEEFQTQIDLIRKYQTISNELRTTRKGDIESNIRNLTLSRENLLANTVTPEMFADFTTSAAMTSSQVTSQENDILNRIPSYSEELRKVKKAAEDAGKEVKAFGDAFAGSFLGFSFSNVFEDALRSGIQFFTKYDETLTRTQMVTGMARDEVLALTESYNELAQQLSSTTKAVADAQLVFYQQGLGTEEALAMTEASIAISKTGGIEAGEAADRLTAAIRGYQLSAEDAMDIADKMSALDAAAASSVNELTVAMQKSASQARMAGLDLDYYMAYLSTMQEVTREAPENIGTAMKSITSRIQEITDIGKVEEDGTTFSNVAEALNSIGIAALDTQGQLRPLQEILNELGPMWASLDRNHQAYIATVLAGNRQQSRFIALMDNYDRALQLVDISQNSTGESARQLRAYEDGLESSLVRLQNAWQQLATSLTDSDMISNIIDMVSEIIEFLDAIPDSILRTITYLTALSKSLRVIENIGTVLRNNPIFGKRNNSSSTIGNLFPGLDTSLAQVGKTISARMGEIATSIQTRFSSMSKTISASISGAFGGFSDGADLASKSLTSTTAAVQNYSASLNQSKISQDLQSSTFVNSANQASTYNEITKKLAESIGINTKAIRSQMDTLNLDDPAWAKQIQDAIDLNYQVLGDSKKYEEALTQDLIQANRLANFYNDDKNRSAFLKNEEKAFRSEFRKAQKGHYSLMDMEGNGAMSYLEKGLTEEDYVRDKIKTAGSIWDAQADANNSTVKVLSQSNAALRKYNAQIEDNLAILQDEFSTTKEKNEAVKRISILSSAREAVVKGDIEQARKIEAGEITPELPVENKKGDSKSENSSSTSRTKFVNTGINAIKSYAIGSIVDVAAEAITGSEAVGDFAGRLTGLTSFITNQFPKLAGLPGLGISAALTVGITLLDKMTASTEELQEELDGVQEEFDTLSQDIATGSSALSTYEELSKKINLTEEEQEDLNSAAAQLADLIPNAVKGYDELGNAIINTTAAQEELNAQKEKEYNLAKRQVELVQGIRESQYDNSFLNNFITWINPANWFDGKTTAELIQEQMNAYNIENADIFETGLSVIAEKYMSEIDSEYESLASTITTDYSTSLVDRYTSGTANAEVLQNQFESFMRSLSDVNWLDIDGAINEAILNSDADYTEIRDNFSDKVTEILQKAGIEDTQIEIIIDLILGVEVDGYSEVNGFIERLEEAIENETDETNKLSMQNFLEGLKNMDIELANIAAELGLLDIDLIEVINSYGGLERLINDLTNPETGEIDKGKGYVVLQRLYDERKALEEELEKREKLINDLEKGAPSTDIRDIIHSVGTSLFPEDVFTEGVENGLYLDYLQDGEINSGIFTANFSRTQFKEFQQAFNDYKKTSDEYQDNLQKEKEGLTDIEGQLGAVEDQIIAVRTAITATEDVSFKDMANSIQEGINKLETLSGFLTDLENNDNVLTGEGRVSLLQQLNALEELVDKKELPLDTWRAGIDAIANGISVVNGQIVMNEEAQAALNAMTQESIRLGYQEEIQKLQVQKANLENQRAMLQASHDMLQSELQRLKTMSDEEYDSYKNNIDLKSSLANFMRGADIAMVQSTKEALEETESIYATHYQRLIELSQAEDPLSMFNTFGDLETSGSKLANSYFLALEEEAKRLKGLFGDTRQEAINNIAAEIYEMEKGLGYFDEKIDIVDSKLKLYNDLADESVDLMGTLGVASDSAADSLDDYNEQLERTLTLLEQIEGIQHKIDENDAFRDLYDDGYNGTRRGELLAENLRLYEKQFGYYQDLFDMQQEMTNQAAGDLLDSPYGDLFNIAENGDIGWATTEMYDRYKDLPNDMQEDIDNLVQAFQEQRDALRETENELINYAEAVKDAREEILDLIEESEDLILETLKNREEVLHEARIKALEDEIDMIEEAVEARNDAREEQDNAEDLFEAQEALRRATLDSSGKNNATLLQLQQDLEDKQQEISEKRFEDDMDARKEYLQAIIDAENETYEYRLETMTWYWEQVELMQQQSTERIMNFLMEWNEDYLTSSQTSQLRLTEQWQGTFDQLNAIMKDTMTDSISDLKNQFLDLASGVEAIDVKVQALAGTWQKVTENANAASSAMSGAGGSGSISIGGSGGNSNRPKYYTKYTGTGGKYINEDALTNGEIDKNKVWTSTTDNYGHYYMPNNVGGSPVHKTGVTAKEIGLKYNSSKVGISSQVVWMSDKGHYYLWNGSIGRYELATSLYGKYGNPEGFNTAGTAGGGQLISYPSESQLQMQLRNLGASRYARGGLVDYTGPAWVDGSTSRPEAFLSSYQTEQIGALAKALDSSSVNAVSNSSNVTFGAITFNVASMSSAADGRKALDTFVKGANEMMAKKGVNTTLNLNYK